ncbi:Hsp70 family protein [Schaalia cardiffensis]|nr:Hsp70 family protein [Schaalia cardiffensis]
MTPQPFGIDLGTTYSAIAIADPVRGAEVIANFEGENTTPSVVHFEDDGSAVIGAQAKREQISDPDNTSSLVKRHMGESFPLDYRGQTFTPESISALILKELVANANNQRGTAIEDVVITVPAYFGVQERQATRQAGVIAGLKVVSIIPEPVAASISVSSERGLSGTFMVFDLGGGTFDTTVMRASQGRVDVIAIDGNRLLGGADWDRRLEQLFLERFRESAGLGLDRDPEADEDFMVELRASVEEAKKTLSRRPSAAIRMKFEDISQKIEVGVEEFEEATHDLVEQTLEIAKRCIETAKAKTPGLEIDHFLLVGGSCRMPMIENRLRAEGFTPEATEYDLAVAKGAAIFALGTTNLEIGGGDYDEKTPPANSSLLVGPGTAVAVSNVLARGVGVKVTDVDPSGAYIDSIAFLAHANDSIPMTATLRAGTLQDNQTRIQIELYEQLGEVECNDTAANRELVSGPNTCISGLPPLPKGSPVDINIEIDSDGTILLTGKEPTTGKEVRATASVSVLTEEEVEASRVQIAAITTQS